MRVHIQKEKNDKHKAGVDAVKFQTFKTEGFICSRDRKNKFLKNFNFHKMNLKIKVLLINVD